MTAQRPHSPSLSSLAIRWLTVLFLVTLLTAAAACSTPSAAVPVAHPSGIASPSASGEPDPNVVAAGGRSFTLIGSGDVLLHDGLWHQAAADARAAGRSGYYFGPMYASLKPIISGADLAICHMEPPLGTATGPFSGYPRFSVPPQIAVTLKDVGYDSCSTASNHSIDQGEAGVIRTIEAFDAVGMHHTGTARTQAEANRLNIFTIKDVKVAHLSYTFSLNGLREPAGKSYLANDLNTAAVLAEAHRAKAAGASVVIVSIHWGTEYSHVANGQQLSVAKKLLSTPDVDLILGHHAHVVQPLERIGDKWVAYGMGNQVSYQNFSNDTRDGIMPRFTFTEVSPGKFQVTKAEVIAIFMSLNNGPARVFDTSAVLASRSSPSWLRALCQASLERTASVIGQRGAYDDGLTLLG